MKIGWYVNNMIATLFWRRFTNVGLTLTLATTRRYNVYIDYMTLIFFELWLIDNVISAFFYKRLKSYVDQICILTFYNFNVDSTAESEFNPLVQRLTNVILPVEYGSMFIVSGD